MADKRELPRAAVVVNTKEGERIKPACPMCHRTSWVTPKLTPDDKHKDPTDFQAVVTATRGEELLSLPVAMFICQNCGFVWHVAMNVDREHEVGGGDG